MGEGNDFSELSETQRAQIARLEKLLSAPPADFAALSQALMEDKTLKEIRPPSPVEGAIVREESPSLIATRRLNEVLLIWNERQNDADIGSLILSWARTGKGVAYSHQITKIVVNYMRKAAYTEGSEKLRGFLEELTTIFLGVPSERARALEALPDINTDVSWAIEPMVAKYLAILKLMVGEPVLIFPAIEKAAELGLMERLRIHEWIEDSDFKTIPQEVIARLNLSPLVGDLAEFRVIPRSSGLYFPSNFPKEATLFDWVVVEIGKLSAEDQKPFLDFLKEKKTFGAEVMLALLSKEPKSRLAALLKERKNEISELSDERKKEMAAFVIPKLAKDGAEVRAFFEEALVDENEIELEKFKESLMPGEETSRTTRGNEPGEVFLRFYQQDAELALRALRVAQSAQEEGKAKVAMNSSTGRDLQESWVSDLLERIDRGINPPEQGRTGTKFYLKVLADEKLAPSLIVNSRLLTPEFIDAQDGRSGPRRAEGSLGLDRQSLSREPRQGVFFYRVHRALGMAF